MISLISFGSLSQPLLETRVKDPLLKNSSAVHYIQWINKTNVLSIIKGNTFRRRRFKGGSWNPVTEALFEQTQWLQVSWHLWQELFLSPPRDPHEHYITFLLAFLLWLKYFTALRLQQIITYFNEDSRAETIFLIDWRKLLVALLLPRHFLFFNLSFHLPVPFVSSTLFKQLVLINFLFPFDSLTLLQQSFWSNVLIYTC